MTSRKYFLGWLRAWGDFLRKSNVICNTVWFQSVPSFSKVILEFSGMAPVHQFTLQHERQALCSLPEHQSHKHLENSWWSLLSSLERCSLKSRPYLKMFTPLFDTSSLCFSASPPNIPGQYWSPSWQNTPFPSITHKLAEWLIFFPDIKTSFQKKNSRQINAETQYQRLLLSLSVLQSMPALKISRADSTATKPCSCEHPLSEK